MLKDINSAVVWHICIHEDKTSNTLRRRIFQKKGRNHFTKPSFSSYSQVLNSQLSGPVCLSERETHLTPLILYLLESPQAGTLS